jgi:hypothetical protein
MPNVNEMLSEAIQFQTLNTEDALANGNYPASGYFIHVGDMIQFGFKINAGALTSAITAKVQQADAVDGTPSDVTNATVTIAATDDDKQKLIEVKVDNLTDDTKPYVSLNISGAADSDDYASIEFMGVPKFKPATQSSDLTVVTVAG